MRRLVLCVAVCSTLLCARQAVAVPSVLSHRLAVPGTGAGLPLKWGKDPFVQPGTGEGRETGDLRLTAVFYGDKNPSAIVNNRIVYRGSIVGGQKVVDIGFTHVILDGDRGRLRLELSEIPELHDANKKD